MVRFSYQEIDDSYEEIKQSACGRQACTVMIMVAYEVDAMAATKILSQQLRRDNIAYTIRPVMNFTEVEHNFRSYITTDIKTIFMINCGAVNNIPKVFKLSSGGDMRCFIFDNHRPFHLANIHSRHNVVVFDDMEEIEEDSRYDQIPADGSDLSSMEEDDEDDEQSRSGSEDSFGDDADDIGEDNEATEDNIDAAFGEEEEDGEGSGGEDEEEAEEGDDEEGGGEEGEAAEEETLGDGNDESEGDSLSGDRESDQEEQEDDLVSEKKRTRRSELSGSEVAALEETVVGEWGGEGSRLRSDDEGDETRDLEQGEHEQEEQQEQQDEDEEEVRVVGRKRKLTTSEARAKQRKAELVNYYSRSAWYAAPTSVMLMHLVGHSGSHVPIESLWQAVLGVTDQFQRGNVPEISYNSYCDELKAQLGHHISTASERVRYYVPSSEPGEQDAVAVPGSENGNIRECDEYRFFLYRHWSLLEAMQHSPYIAAKLSVWNSKGVSKLNELLAKMGIPLAQCQQLFQFMTPSLRNHFDEQIQDPAVTDLFHLHNPGVTYKSFYRFNSFKNPVAAADVVSAASALVEMYGVEQFFSATERDERDLEAADVESAVPVSGSALAATSKISSIDAFFEAYSCLNRSVSDSLLKKGVQTALELQKAIVKKASVMMDGRESIQRGGRLYYAYLHKTSASAKGGADGDFSELEHSFGRPMVLTRLGQFIMDVKRNMSKKDGGWTGSALLPLVLLSERSDETYLVVGISPYSSQCGGEEISDQHAEKLRVVTNFRMFFELAAKDIHVKLRNNSFETNMVVVGKHDAQDFLGTLDHALKKAK